MTSLYIYVNSFLFLSQFIQIPLLTDWQVLKEEEEKGEEEEKKEKRLLNGRR